MNEGLAPLLAVGLVDGQAQMHRYRAREPGESSSSDSSDDDSDSDSDAAAKREKKKKKKRLAANPDDPPVRKYASSLAWSRPPPPPVKAGDEPPSCRAVRFMGGGGGAEEGGGAPLLLACGYGDGSLALLDVESGGKEVWRAPQAHAAAVSRVLPAPGARMLLAAGDEDGVLCLWDARRRANASTSSPSPSPAVRCAEHTDFISDLCAGGSRRPHMMLATSGDGTLSVHDVRAAGDGQGKGGADATKKQKKGGRGADGLVARSEPGGADDELLSLAVARGGSKVVAGGQSGVLSIFSWGEWEDPSDRFPGHPESVDALAALDGDTLLTGSSDGLIRVIGLFPNRLMGILGVHGDDGAPVERLAVGGGGGGGGAALRALASSGHGECVRLWDLGAFFEEDSEEEEEAAEERAVPEAAGPGAAVLAAAARAAGKKTGRGSEDDDDKDSDDDSDSDDEGGRKRRKRERTRMTKHTRDGGLAAKKTQNFFAGLLDD
jgi:WD40 repeat protein